jgi:hypothetical protein
MESLRSDGAVGAVRPMPKGERVNISKDQILQFLRDRGQADKADQAASELPDQVDTDQHADLLSKFGIDPQQLLGQLGSKLGNIF